MITFQSFKVAFSKKRVWIPSLILIIAIILVVRGAGGTKGPQATSTAKTVRGPITEQVFVTGAVKAADTIDLAFEKTGKVAVVKIAVGQHVSRGSLLAALGSDTEYANVQSAQARLRSEQARLADMQNGSRPEEIAIAQSDLDSARLALANSYADIGTSLQDAAAKADSAVNQSANPLFRNPQSQNPTLSFSTSNQAAETNLTRERVVAGSALAALQAAATNPGSDPTAVKSTLSSAIAALQTIQSFMNDSATILTYTQSLDQSTAATYATNVNTGRTNVNAAASSLATLKQSIDSEEVAVEKAAASLALKKAGSTPEQIAAEQAAVDAANADVLTAQAAYGKDFMYAPADGTITAKNVEVGEISTANAPAISMQSDGQFRLEANIPEADIAKVAVGNAASTTLDAYGSSENFPATVSSIDPAEKIIDGVATYKVTLDFLKPDTRVRSGMTANITIVTNHKDNVISIPQRAVSVDGGKSTVQVVHADGTLETRTVVTGLRGGDGSIEIASGLSEGETVATFVKQ